MTEETPSILTLLRDFAKQDGCTHCAGDANKIKILEEYLWVRQLTPNLSFEEFLRRYAPLADYDAKNLKHPADAVRTLLPRSKKLAEERNAKQWSAKEALEYLSLYIDMIRLAETTQQPIPMTLVDFLQSESLLGMYAAGEFAVEEPTPAKSKKVKKQELAQSVTAVGQRCIYTTASGRQYRGHVTELDLAAGLATIHTDGGELFPGLAVATLTFCEDPPVSLPRNTAGEEYPVVQQGRLRISPAEYDPARAALALPSPLGNVALGDAAYAFCYKFTETLSAYLEVCNGNPHPYVNAVLVDSDTDAELCILAPRTQLPGTYQFVANGGTYILEVLVPPSA